MHAAHKVDHFGAGAYIPLPPSPTNGRTLLRRLTPPSLNTEARPLASWETLAACALATVGLQVSQSPIRPCPVISSNPTNSPRAANPVRPGCRIVESAL